MKGIHNFVGDIDKLQNILGLVFTHAYQFPYRLPKPTMLEYP